MNILSIYWKKKININKLFFNTEDIIKFIKSKKDVIPENKVNNSKNLKKENNNSENNNLEKTPFYSEGKISDNILLLKKYLKEKLLISNNANIHYTIIDNLNITTLPDYFLNLQNKKLLSILSSKLISYNDEMKTSIFEYHYFLYDKSSKNRSGRGILGFISVKMYDIKHIRPRYNIFRHRRWDRFILPAYVDWTCSFIAEDKKNNIKQNLSVVESSIAKYMTDEVCKIMINEYREAWPKYPIDAVLLFSTTLSEARPSHLRNGKLMACSFLYEWKNGDGITMYKHFDVDGRYELTSDNTIGLATMYYMYPTDGTRFEKGTPLYDELMTVVDYYDFGSYVHKKKTRSNISTRRINQETGEYVQGYTEDAFKCLYQPQVIASDLSPENAQRISFYKHNPNTLGGKRKTMKRRKTKKH